MTAADGRLAGVFGERRRRREQELVEKDRWRVARKLMDEDVTVLGEQVAQLHVDTFTAVEQVVADARYHRAAVICLRDGEPLPERREPCFFNPQHGPSMQDVQWAPPSGTARTIGVCAADARALAAGDEPLVRMVRVGDRWVPWHLSGGMEGAIDAGHRWRRPAMAPIASRASRRPTSTRPREAPTAPRATTAADPHAQTRCSRRAASAIEPLIEG